MHWLLLAGLLAATPDVSSPPAVVVEAPVQTCESIAEACDRLSVDVQPGTLLFSKGDCLAVKVFTQSEYTHVAMVMLQEGQPYVYDSMNGAGVRKLPLKDYLQRQSPDVVHVFQPREPLTLEQERLLTEALERELGRPYAVRHHLTGKTSAGLHCAEYMTYAFMHSRMLYAERPSRVSPASLVEGIVKGNLYAPASTLTIEPPAPERPEGDTWCERLWLDTKYCTLDSCRKLRRLFLCR